MTIPGLAVTRFRPLPEGMGWEAECYTPSLLKWTFRVFWMGKHWGVEYICAGM